MERLTRRDILRWMALQFGALAGSRLLAACGKAAPTHQSASPPRKGLFQTATPLAATTEAVVETASDLPAPQVTSTSIEYPHLVVARAGEPEALVRTVLGALGGMSRFVGPGDDVIIKPNICVSYHSYEYAATTNPWVVGGLVKLCFEAGAGRVRVMDYPFGGTCEQAYLRSGIQEQVQAAGGFMEPISAFKFVSTEIPRGVDLKVCEIYDDILQADVVINVPIAKHHSLARLTLGMKNLMGTIRNRSAMHQNLGQRLADLSSRITPALTVVDAVRILRAHGPTGGSLDDVQRLDTLIASADLVAADSFAATLFDLRPVDLRYVVAGETLGLGRSDLENLRIEQVSASG